MLVPVCNRCGRETRYSYYKFNIDEHVISGSLWEKFNGPNTRLDDLHLCPNCMADFVEFIKEGKRDVK